MDDKDKIMLDGEKYVPFASDCTMCDHFNDDNFRCAAFPDGIPDTILTGHQKHKSVIAGQKGNYICTFTLS